jgi:hypothetical protein
MPGLNEAAAGSGSLHNCAPRNRCFGPQARNADASEKPSHVVRTVIALTALFRQHAKQNCFFCYRRAFQCPL